MTLDATDVEHFRAVPAKEVRTDTAGLLTKAGAILTRSLRTGDEGKVAAVRVGERFRRRRAGRSFDLEV